jgi:hypothetical protein
MERLGESRTLYGYAGKIVTIFSESANPTYNDRGGILRIRLKM